jgi:hypothetical protein
MYRAAGQNASDVQLAHVEKTSQQVIGNDLLYQVTVSFLIRFEDGEEKTEGIGLSIDPRNVSPSITTLILGYFGVRLNVSPPNNLYYH